VIAVVFALREEVKPLLKEKRVLLWQTGVGMARAHEAAEKLLQQSTPSLILSVGYAGAADPDLKPGTLVVPTEIRSETPTDRFPTDSGMRTRFEELIREEELPLASGPLMTRWKLAGPADKSEAYQRGSIAIDMETAAVAAVAKMKRIPLVSLRVIFDDAKESLFLKSPKTILKIPKYLRWNRLCQKNLAQVLGRFIDLYGDSGKTSPS